MSIDSIRTYILTEILNDDTASIADDEDLLISETLDSLGVMRLVAHLESEIGHTIPPEDVTLENFQSLERIADYLRTRGA